MRKSFTLLICAILCGCTSSNPVIVSPVCRNVPPPELPELPMEKLKSNSNYVQVSQACIQTVEICRAYANAVGS